MQPQQPQPGQNQIPNQPPQQQQPPQNQNPYTIDYLNQIAPKQKKPFFDMKMKIVSGLLVVALIIGLFMIFSGGGSNETSKEALLKLYLRIQSTSEISKNYQSKLKNSQLSAINSGLSTTLSSDETKLKTRLDNLSITVPKVEKDKTPPKVVAEVNAESEKLDKTLDDAHLNAVLDRTYSREMNYQLEVIDSSIKTIKTKDKSQATAEVLDAISKNLQVTIEQINNYQKTDS